MYNSGESFKKGQAFENFVETILFPKSDYDLVEKTHDYSQNSVRFVESTTNPDFKFRCRKTDLKNQQEGDIFAAQHGEGHHEPRSDLGSD
jgi:hypothetical protein